jgi:predicted O-methyltransferase YrrM
VSPRHIRRATRAAAALYEAGRPDDAIALFERLLKLVPNDARLLHNLAVVQYKAGHIYQGVETLKKSLMADPYVPDAFITMADMLADEGYQNYLKAPFYGPFNGQQMRQAIFSQMVTLMRPATIFETGTFRGTSTAFMAGTAPDAHLYSCELEINFFRFASAQLRDYPNVTVVNLDSRSFLRRYVPLFSRPDTPSLFYLDAHWDADDLPLLEELKIVFAAAPRAVVMIDDFQVWDDNGYAFDDYGPTRTLNLHYLRPLAPLQPHIFFPITSAQETGVRRGSVVITIDPALADRLGGIPQLRPAPPQPDA